MEPLHPTEQRALSTIERTLWRFSMVAHEARVMWRGFNSVGDVAKDVGPDLMFGLSNQALVIVSKFLEVWDSFGTLARTDERVVTCRRAIQPLVDRIRVWKGLDRFRNSTLAHAYLDREGKLLPPWELFRAGLAPTYHAETVLLLQCTVFASYGILAAFENDYLPIHPLAGPGEGPSPTAAPGIQFGTEIEPVVRPICVLVDESLKRDLGVRFAGPLFDLFRKGLEPRRD